MKTIKVSQKLSLAKKTLAKLSNNQNDYINGGAVIKTVNCNQNISTSCVCPTWCFCTDACNNTGK